MAGNIRGITIEKQAKITRLLSTWIGREDKLIFDDRLNLFYKAKVFAIATPENNPILSSVCSSMYSSLFNRYLGQPVHASY